MAQAKAAIGAPFIVVSLRKHPRAQTFVTHYLGSNLETKKANKFGKVHDILGETVKAYQDHPTWAEYRLTDGYYLMKQPSETETYAKVEPDGSIVQLPKPTMRVAKVEGGKILQSDEAAVRAAFKMPAKVGKAKAAKVLPEHSANVVILNW